MNEENLTTDEAAKFLRISIRTLYSYIKAGKIPYSKPSGIYYFKKSNLQAFMDGKIR